MDWLWVLAFALALALAGCGGGGSERLAPVRVGLPQSAASLSDSNVALVEVGPGLLNRANMAFVSITVCVPGSARCVQVDHMLLDTASTGVRIFSSALAGLDLPKQTSSGADTVYQCARFLTTRALGTVHLADVRIGGEQALVLPIQRMDTSYPLAADSPCNGMPLMAPRDDVAHKLQGLGANGILGVGPLATDGEHYFSCERLAPDCALPTLGVDRQVANPVGRFATNNNGMVVQLPRIPAAGANTVQGYLVFGVNTQSNNQWGAAKVVAMNANGPYFTTTYQGRSFAKSLMDSGSNSVLFDDAALAGCPVHTEFYCPPSTVLLTAGIATVDGLAQTIAYSVANTDALFVDAVFSGNYAFDNLAAPLSQPPRSDNPGPYFVWGLPFFFGRSVYTVMEGAPAGNGLRGPLHAFSE